MSKHLSRKQFLSGDLSGRRIPLRPPWAVNELQLDELCSGCGDCVRACKSKLIKLARGRLPVIDFKLGACTFCEDCLLACETGALFRDKNNAVQKPWHIVADIAFSNCLAEKGVMCRTCGDVCEQRAIQFKLKVGGFSQPQMNSENCSGCGACMFSCPVQAIQIRHIEDIAFIKEQNSNQPNMAKRN